MIRAWLYNDQQLLQSGAQELIEFWLNSDSFLWLDIQQALCPQVMDILKVFNLHDHAIKDVQRDKHPPKLEVFSQQAFILFKGIEAIDEDLSFISSQLALFVGERYLITIHPNTSLSIGYHIEHCDDLSKCLSHTLSPQSLACSIMHHSCAFYLEMFLDFDHILTEVEDEMIDHGSDELLKDLIRYRSQLRKLKRTFKYHEKLSKELLSLWSDTPDTNLFKHDLRNLYDRCERLASLSTQQYEICGDLVDGYFSLSSHQLNQTMRILTVITAIFVPLSFLAGLYGMNFEYIPELKLKSGYFILLAVMFSLALSMIVVFKRKKWF